MKSAAKFTREAPCTKVDLHLAFWVNGQYRATAVVQAKAVIGDNAPKYMLKKGFLVQSLEGGVDMYTPTETGKNWLRDGLARHLELHPEDAEKVALASPAKPPKQRVRRVIRRT